MKAWASPHGDPPALVRRFRITLNYQYFVHRIKKSESVKNETVHPVVDIFPSVTRCPYKDGFHAVQLVTGTFNAGTGEVDVHSRDVGSTIRPAYEKDVKKAVDFLVKSERLSRPEARREAFKRYRGTGIIRSFGPQPDDLRQRWQGHADK